MGTMNKFSVDINLLDDLVTKSASSDGKNTIPIGTARAIETWIRVTAIDAATNYDFEIRISIDGTNFDTLETVNVTATGIFRRVFNRADDPIGTQVRIRLVKNSGGDITFENKLVRME